MGIHFFSRGILCIAELSPCVFVYFGILIGGVHRIPGDLLSLEFGGHPKCASICNLDLGVCSCLLLSPCPSSATKWIIHC